jgi:hypothetical protein
MSSPATRIEREGPRGFLRNWFYRSGDFTRIFTTEILRAFPDEITGAVDGPDRWYQYCCERANQRSDAGGPRLTSFEFSEDIYPEVTARLQVSRAFDGSAWSVSVRWEAPKAHPGRKAIDDSFAAEAAKLLDAAHEWKPSDSYNFPEKLSGGEYPFPFSIRDVVEGMFERVQDAQAPHQGLVLLTGPTNAAKSLIARGLVWQRLSRLVGEPGRKRRPHLVTFEDPIEKYLWRADSLPAMPGSATPAIDYTPRQAVADCASLKEALTGALRQTPSVFYIGEIRSEEEMRRAVEFGGTGHFVVATAHAGSLIEAVSKILNAVEAKNSGARAIYAPKILAVIHLKRVTFRASLYRCCEPEPMEALVPTMYRQTAQGLQSLVADGLASLLPYCPEKARVAQYGSLGRQFFAKELCSVVCDRSFSGEVQERWKAIMEWNCGRGALVDKPGSLRLTDAALLEDLYGR